jgi:hypothetical protein
MWRKQAGKSSCNFWRRFKDNCTPLCPKIEKKIKIQGQIK